MSKVISIEEKMEQLRTLVGWFESDEFQLEAASDKFKQATKLAEEIEQHLASLKNDIEVVKQSFDQAQ